uniref:Tyrosine recombinase n=1 Tax=Trachysalambria curvirostris nimavirus TaxID=2984282 RepID=A0A9C7C6U6_9VIRU|nr:MAG: tyrosine recombinase [Trachysalambria curvirostris nimavirus]
MICRVCKYLGIILVLIYHQTQASGIRGDQSNENDYDTAASSIPATGAGPTISLVSATGTTTAQEDIILYIPREREETMRQSEVQSDVQKILGGPEPDPNKPTCIICKRQYVNLKRHIRGIHKKTGKELERVYSEAMSMFKGFSLQNCNICSRGVRHMKYHLQNAHGLYENEQPEEYKRALGTNTARLRTVTVRRKKTIRERREGIAKVPVSVQAWIAYESRGGLTTTEGGRGMLRNVKLVTEILKKNSLEITDLIDRSKVERAYRTLYETLIRERKYKHMSVSVLLGHLRRFLDWACAEANSPPVCEFASREHAYYTKLCRRKGNRENMERKVAEYVPAIEEMGPLIRYSKHRHVVDGLINRPRETLEEYGVDLIHAALAWPLIIRSGARTGVIQNLLTSEVNDAIQLSAPNGAVIKVKNHKTSLQYGPYQLGVTTEEHQMLRNFIACRDWESDYVFSSKKGSKFSMANIQRFMKKLFSMYSMPRLRIATIRKFLTTQAHRDGDDRIQEATASLLKHSMKTARRDYKAMQRDCEALRTANHLSKMLQERLGKRTDNENCGSEDDYHHSASASTTAEADYGPPEAVTIADDIATATTSGAIIGTSATNAIHIAEDNNNDAAVATTSHINDAYNTSDSTVTSTTISVSGDGSRVARNANTVSSTCKKRGGNCRFQPQHLDLIKKVFRRHIAKRKNPSLQMIKDKREELREIYEDSRYDPNVLSKKIFESVRSQIRLRQNRDIN